MSAGLDKSHSDRAAEGHYRRCPETSCRDSNSAFGTAPDETDAKPPCKRRWMNHDQRWQTADVFPGNRCNARTVDFDSQSPMVDGNNEFAWGRCCKSTPFEMTSQTALDVSFDTTSVTRHNARVLKKTFSR